MPVIKLLCTFISLVGCLTAASALYGRYRILPAFLTGPQICKQEMGGCQTLFRSPQAALLGVPNAALGLIFYWGVIVGLWLHWPWILLELGAVIALGMSVYLGIYLLRKGLQCRVCWLGHGVNTLLFFLLPIEAALR